ncbi:Succinate dehydrogenase hydrophobic membrane anchor protein [Rhodovulum sp. P5]|uniref:succinate dehydrogenase, hydrophobic membrane anchor protein n=1 Tax=Rhodovulum sp. P5 TaxID=1564506 RepID=UPI0009C23A65|nr:succinate dehydrogenase, hydrophobic membrane anchor protein [Rhodovulum sp. P5]ARE38758.1 Succinate dehydrogenase hydrophobic membrane anchor protein [Rhodovulum sp. P5]
MRYLTDRKRALGLGAAKTGTAHHWYMIVSAVALVFLVPAFVFIFGSALGSSHADVVATFSSPFAAIVAILTIVVGMQHFSRGAQMMIEDYAQGLTRKVLVIVATCISYAALAAGVYAVIRIAI